MHCTTTSHVWLWTGSGTSEGIPDHLPCQCHRYTAGEWYSLRAENARLQALLAERDAEIARLVELGERMRLAAMYYAANGGDVLCIEFHAACEAWRAALAARGGAS